MSKVVRRELDLDGKKFVFETGELANKANASVLASLIDRSIRPLFPKDYQAEVQVVITVLSVDQENDPDVVSLNAASCALSISDIPWNGPIAGIRVGRQNGGFISNPTDEEKTFF